ncbi:MAG: GNAT family N-acetyltransferase [Phycisphaerales bacterium]|nr:GNAT family N-acetyltransferase [Phycisphaerales bacterium]
MSWQPTTLAGHGLSLVPLTRHHAADLFAITPPDNFKYFLSWPIEWSLPAFTAWIEKHTATPGNLCFAVLDASTGRAIGSSTFHDIQSAHRHAEIGSTWYDPARRGTTVNPACKLLMLSHAFEQKACIRVTIKCDARNAHSRAAILKLGATFEGILRHHRIQQNGFARDTVYFSILRDEWPGVKEGLLARLS